MSAEMLTISSNCRALSSRLFESAWAIRGVIESHSSSDSRRSNRALAHASSVVSGSDSPDDGGSPSSSAPSPAWTRPRPRSTARVSRHRAGAKYVPGFPERSLRSGLPEHREQHAAVIAPTDEPGGSIVAIPVSSSISRRTRCVNAILHLAPSAGISTSFVSWWASKFTPR